MTNTGKIKNGYMCALVEYYLHPGVETVLKEHLSHNMGQQKPFAFK